MAEEYASKAAMIQNCWRYASQNSPPGPLFQGIFEALEFSERHDSPEPAVDDGYHIDVMYGYRTLYFTRPLTEEEKAEIDSTEKIIRRAMTPV